jgi:hypothetical protein
MAIAPPKEILHDTVYITGVDSKALKDRWALFDRLSQYGEIADLRVGECSQLATLSSISDENINAFSSERD